MVFQTVWVTVLIVAILVFLSSCGESLSPNPFWNRDDGDVTVKPGNCPASDPRIFCKNNVTDCVTDCNCPKYQKCCYQDNCGNFCKEPTVCTPYNATCYAKIAEKPVKKGVCPMPPNDIVCIQCNDQCRSDCECPGLQKCCKNPNGCGNLCYNATYPVVDPTTPVSS